MKTIFLRRLILIAVVFLSFTMPACAQSQFLVDRLSVEHGLSQADVRCMIQDKFGFLWIGTRDGLNRYDGYSFETFHIDNKGENALAFNQIYAIDTLPKGQVVIGSAGGISIYDPQLNGFSNHFFQQLDNISVNDIEVKDDELILATNRGLRFFHVRSGKFFVDKDYDELSDFEITQVKVFREDEEWVGTTRGLFVRSNSKEKFKSLLNDSYIYHIDYDGDRAFISTSKGLFHLQPGTWKLTQIPLTNPFQVALQAIRASNGEIWVASNQVLVLSPDGRKVINILAHDQTNHRTLSEDRAKSLYETSDGVIWIGTFGYGLNRHDPATRNIFFVSNNTPLKLSSRYVSAVYSRDDSVIFVGTPRGVNIVDLRKKTISIFDPYDPYLPGRLFLVYAIKADKNGVIWMTGVDGLYAWNGHTFVSQGILVSEALDFVEYDSSTLMLVTRVNGCFLFDKNSKEISSFIPKTSFAADLTTAMVEDDAVWVGALDGVRRFDRAGKLIRHFTAEINDSSALASNLVKCLFRDNRKQLWVGTWGGGLSLYNDKDSTFHTLTINDGLPSNVVYGIEEDKKGRLWMSTNNGITALDPEKMTFRSFNVNDGLQSNEFNTGAYCQSSSGRLYFGGINGLNAIDPSRLLPRETLAKIILTEIRLHQGGQSKNLGFLPGDSDINLSWYDNDLTIHFTTIDFRDSEKYRFQYSIKDGQWRYIGNSRTLDLSALATGDYTLKMRSSIDGKTWGNEQILTTIHVAAPFWSSPAVIMGFVILIGSFAYVTHRLRLVTLRTRNEMLNKVVEERTREVFQMNDEISSQNEKLQSQADELALKNTFLEDQKEELQKLQAELEQRVQQRTQAVQTLNEELVKQNAQLEQFSFITAHNFKGPIARMKGLINLLSAKNIPPEEQPRIQTYLETAITDLDNVTHDVNTILHIRQRSREDFRHIPLLPVLQNVLKELENDISRIGMIVNIDGFEPHSAMGISAFVHSAFYNLVENAAKYRTDRAVPSLTIRCFENNGSVVTEFADNGIGIDLKLAGNKMFNAYQRFNYKNSGRGIGLYMVRTQVEMMHGTITVDSELGVGSKFSHHSGNNANKSGRLLLIKDFQPSTQLSLQYSITTIHSIRNTEYSFSEKLFSLVPCDQPPRG